MPEVVIQTIYGRLDTKELQNILKKFKQNKHPDDYHLMCISVVEEELKQRT